MHFDELAHLSQNQAAPEDERWDASSQILRQLQNGGFDDTQVANIHEGVQYLINEKETLAKAIRMEGYQMQVKGADKDRVGRGHDSILYVNEYGLVGDRGRNSRWTEKPGGINAFALLTEIVGGIDIIKMVILTARREIEAFCQPERDSNPLGYRFVRKDGQPVSERDHKAIFELEDWFQHCGDESYAPTRKRMRRDTFATFMRKIVWDSLCYDACPIELETTRTGKLCGMYPVPATTVRLCTEEGYEGHDEIQAIQTIDERPYTAYGFEDLIYEVRNPRTDLFVNGYGYAEPEMILRVLTAWLEVFEYNRAGMSRNTIPRGVMALFGEWGQKELTRFNNQLQASLTGAGNRHRLVTIAGSKDVKGGDLKYVKMDDNFDDMFFAKVATLIFSITTGIYGMHPSQINSGSFESSNSSALSGSDTTEKLANARDKGLIPRLSYLANIFNDWVVPRVNKDYRFEWVGLNEEDAEHKFKREMKGSTVDEIRASAGKKPHENKILGGCPTDESLVQVYMSTLAPEDGGETADENRPGAATDDAGDEDNRGQLAKAGARRRFSYRIDDLGVLQ